MITAPQPASLTDERSTTRYVMAADAVCTSEPWALSLDGAEVGILSERSDSGELVTLDVLDQRGRVAEVSMSRHDAETLAIRLLDPTGGGAVQVPVPRGSQP